MTHRPLDDVFSDELLALPTSKRKKAAISAMREANADSDTREKERRRRERRCWWTPWPFGHVYVTTEFYSTIPNVETCVGCGKTRRA